MAGQNNNAPSTAPLRKKSRFKKILKSKLFWTFVVILLIGGWIGYGAFTQKPQAEYVTEDVKSGTITQTVSATGKVESADEISLNFKNQGKLTEIKVKEGDTVKAGDIIAKLDTAAVAPIVQQYRANLNSARADLARIRAGASTQDIDISQLQFSKAQSDLDNLKLEADVQINTLLIKNLDTISGSVSSAQVALDKLYNNLINTETTENIDFNNSSLEEKVALSYQKNVSELNQAVVIYNNANTQKTNTATIEAAENLRLVLLNTSSLLNDAFELAESIIVKSSYPQASKDAVKTDIAAQRTIINSAITSLQLTNSNLVNGISNYNSQIKAAENSLAIYLSQLNLKRAAPRVFEIESARSKVDLAAAQLSKAQADLNEYTLVAPINGTITHVNFKVGEQTSMSQPVITLLSPEKYEIKVDIPESDIAKINAGNKVFIKLDAFGSDHLFSGTVTFVDPAQTVIQDVVYYRTTVSFDADQWNAKIKSGMTSDVVINTAKKDNVLYIPQRAVKIRETTLGEPEEKYVELLVNGTEVQQKNVTIGLRGDGGLVEVVTGLNEGDKVITFKKEGK